MELLLTDEQKMLRDSATTLVERGAGPKRVRELRETGDGLDRAAWNYAAEAGWLAILASEDCGGLGLGMTELSLVTEQAGRGLMAAPIAAAAISARALADSDGAALRDEVAAAVIGGEKLVVPAFQETALAVDTEQIATTAAADGDGYRIQGRKAFVPDARNADGFLVNARGPAGTVLCYVPADSGGLTLDSSATVDGGASGTLAFEGVAVPADHMVAGPNRAAGLTADIHDRMLLGIGAELLGVMEQALDTTLDYLKIREQFDRPIGSFQALQHRAVNEYVEVEMTRSLLFQVAAAFDEGRGSSAMAAAVKAKASGAGLAVTKAAVQMHGAIGFTDEHDIGLYLKRAMALSAAYGNESAQRGRYARFAGIEPAA